MTLGAATEAIAAGLIVGMPTDTVYGLAVDPVDTQAVGRLFEAKGRPAGKPVGILAADMDQARQIGDVDGEAADLGAAYWPGALTLIVTPIVILSDWVGDAQRRTVGLRVPDHPLAYELLMKTGPLAVTSANRSDEPECLDDIDARVVFGEEVSVYLKGRSPGGTSSTVVDVTGSRPVVLRQGPVVLGG